MTHPAISADTSILEQMEFDTICEMIIWRGPKGKRYPVRNGCNGNSAKYIITYHSSKECKPITIAVCQSCFIQVVTEPCVKCGLEDKIISCTTIKK